MTNMRASISRSVAAIGAIVLAGCSGGGMGGIGATVPYEHSNAIVSLGYQETVIAPDHYKIQVTGYPTTPRERLEKIAATRAAEIGTANRLGYFKINAVEYTSRCKTFKDGTQRGANTASRAIEHVVLTADVVYTKSPSDPSYVEAKTAFPQYRAELDQPQLPAAPSEPAAPSQCG
jgi:hypothetical protein